VTSGEDHEVVAGPTAGTLLRRRRSGAEGLSAPAEAGLLELLAPRVPLRVPTVIAVLSADTMEIERIPGRPLLSLTTLHGVDRRRVAVQLGAFVSAVAQIPRAQAEQHVAVEETDLEEYRDECRSLLPDLADHLPRERRTAVSRFVGTPPPPRPPRLHLAHQDLGSEHVFVDGDDVQITGVIDFSDAAVSDPALDLGLVLRDLGRDVFPAAVAAFTAGGGDMEGVAPRALFYARARALEDFAFGLEHDAEDYTRNARRAVTELFVDVD
jgi:aminoglycoside phosphotransferase (APT) family kinase protein